MILDIYKDALEYSFQDGKRLVKLGIICLFNFLILPIFLELGYSYRVIKVAVKGMINGGDDLPNFDDAISMFIDGLKIFVVKFVYMVVPIILFVILMFIGKVIVGVSPITGGIISFIGAVIGIVLGIVCYILSDLGICHMVNEDESLSAAFDIKALYGIADSIGWLKLVGFYIGLILIMFVIVVIVSIVLGLIFMVLGISAATLTAGAGISGVVILGFMVMFAVFCFILIPFLTIFKARSIGLIYNLKE